MVVIIAGKLKVNFTVYWMYFRDQNTTTASQSLYPRNGAVRVIVAFRLIDVVTRAVPSWQHPTIMQHNPCCTISDGDEETKNKSRTQDTCLQVDPLPNIRTPTPNAIQYYIGTISETFATGPCSDRKVHIRETQTVYNISLVQSMAMATEKALVRPS